MFRRKYNFYYTNLVNIFFNFSRWEVYVLWRMALFFCMNGKYLSTQWEVYVNSVSDTPSLQQEPRHQMERHIKAVVLKIITCITSGTYAKDESIPVSEISHHLLKTSPSQSSFQHFSKTDLIITHFKDEKLRFRGWLICLWVVSNQDLILHWPDLKRYTHTLFPILHCLSRVTLALEHIYVQVKSVSDLIQWNLVSMRHHYNSK